MAVSDVVLNEYTDKEANRDTPVKKEYVNELRDNVQIVVNSLDKHSGARGEHNHKLVTTTESGFFYPDLLNLIDRYIKELDTLEDTLQEDDFPPYGIAIWNGELGNVPANWAVCDGRNGTPDLRQRIAVCWSGGRSIGSAGGSFSHSINTAALIQNHTHRFHNIVGVYNSTGSYERYTRYGQWPTNNEIFPTGWNGVMWSWQETSTTTGSSGGRTVWFNAVTPYVCKYYIMRLPIPHKDPIPKYAVKITAGEGTEIQSNLGGPGTYTVNKGSQLILSMTVKDTKTWFTDGIYINDKRVSEDIIMYVYEDTTVVSKAVKR